MKESENQNKEITSIFLSGLRETVPSLHSLSDERLIKRIGREKVLEAAEDVSGFITSGVAGSLSKNESLALTVQVLKCLSRYITGTMQIPVTVNTIFTSMNLLHYAVNQAFPGYAESKLLLYTVTPVQVRRVA